jgi:hypothetical protein
MGFEAQVSPDRSLSCRATRLNCECAPPAVPQLLFGHRIETSNISSTHRPSTPSLASEIKVLRRPLETTAKKRTFTAYSITSLAIARSDGGTVRLSIVAV